MYTFPYFKEPDAQKIIAFIRANNFALLTGIGEKYPVATQIPLEVEEKEGKLLLHGHIMKKTDHHIAFEKNNKVLVIFTGPHCYVSASWYTNPLMASTWNYMSVHVKGKIIFTDEAGTYEAIKSITNKYESMESAAAFNNLPKAYVMPMLKAIIGFTIEVKSLEHIFKLSQNRDDASKKNIVTQLKKRGDENSFKIAAEMEKRL